MKASLLVGVLMFASSASAHQSNTSAVSPAETRELQDACQATSTPWVTVPAQTPYLKLAQDLGVASKHSPVGGGGSTKGVTDDPCARLSRERSLLSQPRVSSNGQNAVPSPRNHQ
jgi:hypothetical protein